MTTSQQILDSARQQVWAKETNLSLLTCALDNLDTKQRQAFVSFLIAWCCDLMPTSQWHEGITQGLKVAKR